MGRLDQACRASEATTGHWSPLSEQEESLKRIPGSGWVGAMKGRGKVNRLIF